MTRSLLLGALVSSSSGAQPVVELFGQAGIVGRLSPAKSTVPLATVGAGFRVLGSLSVSAGLEARPNGLSAVGELCSAGRLELPFNLGSLFGSLKEPVATTVPLRFVWSVGAGWGSVDGGERWQLRAALALELTSLKLVHLGPFIRYHQVLGGAGESWVSAGLSLRVPIGLRLAEREVRSGDSDGDGLDDDVDRCPAAPEDFDGFQDEDGCPDLDDDQDGVLDVIDQCPLVPEDFDGVEDEDGCPDA